MPDSAEPDFDPFRPAETDLHDEPNLVAAEVVRPAASSDPPRLGIVHIFLWMTCTAVLVTIHQFITHQIFEGGEAAETSLFNLSDAIRAILSGPAVATIFIAITRWLRGMRFPTQPGEWILLVWGLMEPVSLASDVAWGWSASSFQFGSLIAFFEGLSTGLAYVFIAILSRMPIRWKTCLLLPASSAGMEVLLYGSLLLGEWTAWNTFWLYEFLIWPNLLIWFVTLFQLGFATWRDRREGVRRHWLHGIGVLMFGLTTISSICWTIYYQLFFM